MEYIGAKQAGLNWGISGRRVALLCEQGRIDGVVKMGRIWLIPVNAPKPADARIKSGKYIKATSNNLIQPY